MSASAGRKTNDYWSVPRAFEGETVFILGGGSSLKGFEPEVLRGKGRVIAIKEAGLTMCPWADVLYWADKAWCDGKDNHPPNGRRLHLHTGTYKITRDPCFQTFGHDVKRLQHDRQTEFCIDPRKVAGMCSGANAINLAAHFGAKRIVLLGFDMHGPNWDGRKRKAEEDGSYKTRFMPAIGRMAVPLRHAGIEVLNATPRTALGCFPIVKLEDVLPARKKETEDSEIFTPAEEYAEGAEEEQQDESPAEEVEVEVEAAAPEQDEVEPEAGEAAPVGLEMYAGPDLQREIASRASEEPVMLEIRTSGADVVTRRSNAWWRTQLNAHFDEVIEHDPVDEKARFECRKTPA
ncbi:MAG: hypothetical protein AAF942_00105 [Pseudomonadota bacterium]